MSVYDHWENQRELLRPRLAEQNDMAGVVYQVRHALAQTEQNALAELTDDVLRQQAGVLMSALKNSVGLLEVSVSTCVWTPVKQPAREKPSMSLPLLWVIAALLQLAAGILCYDKGITLGWICAAASAAVCAVSLWLSRRARAKAPAQDEARVTLRPDADRLFGVLDGQVRAVERALQDFEYLNSQLSSGTEGADAAQLNRAADLMEALYETCAAPENPAMEAARSLLDGMGLCALEYSEETRRLFNALPSKSETRTLSPAIVSREDNRLLRRGTAAVRVDAA